MTHTLGALAALIEAPFIQFLIIIVIAAIVVTAIIERKYRP